MSAGDGKLPHPLNPSYCEVYPRFSEPSELRKEGRKGAFHVRCPSSGEADVDDNCNSKDCGIDDRIESLGKFNSIARSNEDHTVRDVEGKCGVSILSVAATDRVEGNERKGCYNTVRNAKAQATNPRERGVSSHLMLQKINIEDSLLESQKEKLSTLLLRYQVHLKKNQGNATASNIDSSFKVDCRSPETADQYHSLYAKKCKNKLKRCLPITLLRNHIHLT